MAQKNRTRVPFPAVPTAPTRPPHPGRIHEKRFGNITRMYNERHAERRENEAALQVKKHEERMAEMAAKRAKHAEEAKALRDAAEPVVVDLRTLGNKSAIGALDSAVAGSKLNSATKKSLDAAIHKAGDEIAGEKKKATEAQEEVKEMKKREKKSMNVLVPIFVLMAALIIVLGVALYVISDGGYHATQMRKKGYQRLGQGIRTNPVD